MLEFSDFFPEIEQGQKGAFMMKYRFIFIFLKISHFVHIRSQAGFSDFE